jgi:hypothetical protein
LLYKQKTVYREKSKDAMNIFSFLPIAQSDMRFVNVRKQKSLRASFALKEPLELHGVYNVVFENSKYTHKMNMLKIKDYGRISQFLVKYLTMTSMWLLTIAYIVFAFSGASMPWGNA